MSAVLDLPAAATAVGIDEARLEALGLAVLESLHDAAGPDLRARLGLELHRVENVLVSLCRRDPDILLNRAAGLGLAVPPKPETVAEIRRLYAEAEIDRYFVHIGPSAASEDVSRMLRGAGLAPARGWMKFVRRPGPVPAVRCDLAVREIGPAEAENFGAIAAFGFGLRQESAALVAALVGRPGWRIFMAFDGDRPAGCGALFLHQGMAWTDWGSTDPEFRRRGVQSALLAARVRAAGAAGCDLIATETGEAVPGDPQHSYRNILKTGFREAYLRENWAPSA